MFICFVLTGTILNLMGLCGGFFFFSVFLSKMLWVPPRVLCVLGGYFTTELHPDPHVAARVKDMCGTGKWIAGNGWDKRSLLGRM